MKKISGEIIDINKRLQERKEKEERSKSRPYNKNDMKPQFRPMWDFPETRDFLENFTVENSSKKLDESSKRTQDILRRAAEITGKPINSNQEPPKEKLIQPPNFEPSEKLKKEREQLDKDYEEYQNKYNKPKSEPKKNNNLGTAAKLGIGAAATYGTYRIGKHLYNKYKQKKDQEMRKEAKSKNIANRLLEASAAARSAHANSRKVNPMSEDLSKIVSGQSGHQYNAQKQVAKKPKIKSMDDFLNNTFY